MILERTHTIPISSPTILPKGDRYDLPPGRRQFRLASLLGLLTAGSLVAGFCRWMGLEPVWLIVLEILVVMSWWRIAQLRDDSLAMPMADQAELRDEVRRWQEERELS